MFQRWAGPLITLLIIGGVALIVAFNLNPSAPVVTSAPTVAPEPTPAVPPATGAQKPADFQEFPIGDGPQFQNKMKIAAVWLPPVPMAGMSDPLTSDVIHLEADVHATEANPNGFALDEFVPYLKVRYKIVPEKAEKPIDQGELRPMVAIDGLHYGASVSMPKAGKYQLIYEFEPPSEGGLGRHSDPVTGVAAWWKPFEVRYDWNYPGPPKPKP